MLTRHIVSAAVAATLALASIGLATAQSDTSVGAAAQRVVIQRQLLDADGQIRTFVLQEGVADAGVGFTTVLPEGAEAGQLRLHMGVSGPDGAVDQMLKLEVHGGEKLVTFSFTDAPLPVLLSPLANMLGDIGRPPSGFATGIAGGVVSAPDSMPLPPNLKLEYPAAAERTFTASAASLPLDEAIALIAAESRCNIFRDGKEIVVDWCED